jgi:hypothetical protein
MIIPIDEIPGILRIKYQICNIKTTDDLINIPVEYIKSKTAFGKKCQHEHNLLRNRYLFGLESDDSAIAYFKTDFNSKELFFKSITEFIYAYLKEKQNPRFISIYENRIAQNQRTLEEIAFLLDIEREYVRQIESKLKSELSTLLNGNIVNKIPFYLNKEIVSFIKDILIFIDANEPTTLAEIESFLFNKFKIAQSDSLYNVLYTILNIFNYEIFILGQTKYISKSNHLIPSIKNTFNTILKILKKAVISVPVDDIIIEVKKNLGKKSTENKCILKLLEFNDFFIGDKSKYQVIFTELENFPDCTFRILSERGEPLHFQDILKEINFRRLSAGIKALGPKKCAGVLSTDSRFDSHGRTGYWGLSNWGGYKTVEDKIIDCVRKNNAPISKEQIFSNVIDSKIYSTTTVYTILHSMIDKSLSYSADGKIILSEWITLYGKQTKDERGYDKIEFYNVLKSLLGQNRLTARQIWEKSDKNIIYRLFQQRLESCPNIIVSKTNGIKYYEWVDNINKESKNILSKYFICENAIIELIKQSNKKELSIPEISKKLLTKKEFSKPLIYKVIANSNKLLSSIGNGISKVVQLKLSQNSIQPIPELSELQIHIIKMIENGESPICEYKSTLRFDIIKQTTNTDLEKMVLKTIAAFGNSIGGTLLIGVEDNKNIIGLEKDYQSFKDRRNADQFIQHLTNITKTFLGDAFTSQCVNIEITNIQSFDICCVKVKKSNETIYYKDKIDGKPHDRIFIRTNNSTTELTNPSEIASFLTMRFK